MRNTPVAIGLGLSLLACQALTSVLPAAVPTSTPTLTFSPTPSPTATWPATLTPRPTWKPPSSPLPTLAGTLGPTLTPTVTPTRRAAAGTALPSAAPSAELACRLDWQSPGEGWEVKALQKFSAGWKVTNTGTDNWNPDRVLFTYVSGAKLHNDPVEHLESGIAPGQSVILSVPMRAPANSTSYSTYWSLRRDDVFFCRVAVHIYVK